MFDEPGEVYGRATLAKCPKCDRNHKVKLNWIGNGTPRKFCPACRIELDRYGGTEEASFNRWAAFNTVQQRVG